MGKINYKDRAYSSHPITSLSYPLAIFIYFNLCKYCMEVSQENRPIQPAVSERALMNMDEMAKVSGARN